MASSTTKAPLKLEELTLVDTDSHAEESLDGLRPYIEDSNPGVLRFLDSASHLRSEIYTSTRATPSFSQTNWSDEPGTGGDDLVHDASSPERKRELMEEFDIDYSILSPGVNLNLASVNHDQTAVALANAYNSWLLDTYLGEDRYDGVYANILVAPQAPEKAAEEIDRVANEEGFVGVQLPASGLVPPAGNRWYDPIYEAAHDRGLPVVMHSGNSASYSTFPVQRTWAETFTEDHAFTFPVESMWHMISMVCQGVPERYPDLQILMQEAGVEWLPWMMWRLDDHYLQNSQDVPILQKQPSEYIKDQFTLSTQPLGHTDNAQHLAWVIEAAGGPETVAFASDHPHPDFDTPGELFRPLNSHFDAEAVRGMMGETAMEIFGLK